MKPGKRIVELFSGLFGLALEFAKVPVFALKEINIMRSQKLSYALVFLYPVLAIFSIALVISGTTGIDVALGTTPNTKIPVGVYLPAGESSQELLGELKEFDYIDVKEFSDKKSLLDAITLSKVRLGVEVLPLENQYSFIQAVFYYDNSNFIAASTIVGQVRTAVQSIGFKKSAQTLSFILSDINSIESTLNLQSKKIDRLLLEIDKGNEDIAGLKEKISGINLSALREKLSQFEFYYGEGKRDIATTLDDTNSVIQKIRRHKTTVADLKEKALFASQSIESVLSALDNSIESLSQSGQVAAAESLSMVRDSLQEQVSEIQEINSELAAAEADLVDTEQKITSARQRLLTADTRLDTARENIGEFDESITQLEDILSSAKHVIDETLASKNVVKNDLVEAKSLLEGLSVRLSGLKNYSPQYLSSPIQVKIQPVFEFSRVTSLLPFTIAFVLLLTCLLLSSIGMINEENWGIIFRLKSSPTTLASWLAGKIAGQTIIALFEAFLIFGVGLVFFRVPFPQNMVELFFALVLLSVCFVSIGLWLTNYLKTASNSIFAALLLIVPMLFLSGILVPLEFMPPFLGALARVLPLTAGIEVLQAVYLRNAPLTGLAESVFPLVGITLFCIVTTYLHRKKK